TLQASFVAGASYQSRYIVLSSAGLGGTTFGSFATTNIPSNFITTLSYTPTDVILNLTGVLNGGTVNEQSVSTALNTFFNNGGALPSAFLAFYGLSGSALSSALSQASGEVGATSALAGTQ